MADKVIMVSAAQLASLLMVTTAHIRQLNRDGWIPKTARDRYPLVGAVQGFIRYVRDEQRRAAKTAAQGRLHDARARQIELRTAYEANRLIDLEEAFAFVDEVLGTIRTDISGVPAAVTRDLELRRTIDAAIERCFERTADLMARHVESLRATGNAAG